MCCQTGDVSGRGRVKGQNAERLPPVGHGVLQGRYLHLYSVNLPKDAMPVSFDQNSLHYTF